VDVWGIGLILFVMLAGYMPFSDEENAVLIRKITTLDFKWPRESRMGPGPRDLLQRILVVDPDVRYTIQQIKQHPWFKVWVL
jgi:serine/threonine protein kinase